MSTIETSTSVLFNMEDKIESARSLKSLCFSMKSNKPDNYNEDGKIFKKFENLMWTLFDPCRPIDDSEILDCCKWLFASGDQPDEFSRKIAFYDNAIICGLIWTNSENVIAYRCRTCALHPDMALCPECFLSGNHEGHDFNMYISPTSGTCDCGDVQVMKEKGFCIRHSAQKDKLKAQEDLVVVAEFILPHIFRRLFIHFREKIETSSIEQIVASSGNFINFLQANSNYGAPMKEAIYRVIIDKDIYRNLFYSGKTHIDDKDNVLLLSQRRYKSALETLKSICSKEDAEAFDCPGLCTDLMHETLMDELVFWLVRMDFPQELIAFLLSFLPCENYKQSLLNSFALHYTRIAEILSRPESALTRLADRVNHIIGQTVIGVPSNDVSSQHAFIIVIIASLYSMMKRCLKKCDLHSKDGNCHMVINCCEPIMEQNNYWILANNFHDIVGNRNVTLNFLSEPSLLNLWCSMISSFQGMNVNICQLFEHVEFENRSYEAAFQAETNICASTTFHLLQNLNNKFNSDIILVMLQRVASRIEKWFEDIQFQPPSCWEPPALECCFHLPLHRLYASLLRQAMKLEMSIDIPQETFLRQLIMHPLMIQMTKSAMKCNLWILNGDCMREQDYRYSISQNRCSYIDLDIYLLQFCATKVDPDWFIEMILERFRIVDFLSFSSDEDPPEPQLEMRMLEGALQLIATLITNTVNFDLNEEEGTKMEIATLLCQGDKTYSQILEMLPSKCYCTSPQNVDEILQELADYRAPQFTPGIGMSEGVYTPKSVVWEKHFDPLFLMLRSYQLKDYQTAMNRYSQYLYNNNSHHRENSFWPPYCLNLRHNSTYEGLKQLLHCKTLHSVLFTILYKAVSDASSVYSEDVLSLVVYLLELNLMFSINENSTLESAEIRHTVFDLQFSEWFPGNCIITNLCHKIERVLYINRFELNRDEDSLIPADQLTIIDSNNMQTPHHSVGNVEDCIYMEPNSNKVTSFFRSSFCCFVVNDEPMTIVHHENEPLAMSSSVDCQPSISHENIDNNEPVTILKCDQRLGDEEICEDSRALSETEMLIRDLRMINIEESTLSLLVKLHNKLSRSTYIPNKEQQTKINRVGDGAFFIKNVLDSAYLENELCRSTIDELCQEAITLSTENSNETKENIKKAAKARQQRLLAQFATKQKAVYEQMFQKELPASPSTELASTVENENTQNERVYECVICNSSSKLSTDKPISLVCHWQTTKVLEKSYSYELELLKTTEEIDYDESTESSREVFKKLYNYEFSKKFEKASSLVSLNNSLDVGIYIRTCGHYVHCDCKDAYLQSILADCTQTSSELDVEIGEFYCPLCRQFSNCALPLVALEEYNSAKLLQVMTPLDKESASFINNLLCTIGSNVSPFVFLCNLLRTNLEIYSTLTVENQLQKRSSCNSELVNLIRNHLAFLEPKDFGSETEWFLLTGVTMKGDKLTIDNEVPLLCRDPINLLIRLTLTLIHKIYDSKLFSTLFESIFSLHILQICLRETKAVDGMVVKRFSMINEKVSFETVVQKRTIRSLWLFICQQFAMKVEEIELSSYCADNDLVWNSMETKILTKALQFLRICAILKQSLSGCTFPDGNNFWTDPLTLKNFISDSNEDNVMLSYPSIYGVSAIERWVEHVQMACKNDSEEIIQMTFPSISRKTPRLANLPQNFEVLFRKYHKTKCADCRKSPKEILKCLLCGRIVSWGELCCNSSNFSEFTTHTIDCGAGTCVYMSVESSLVIVVWNKRFCHWGSLYLDSHGEEDIGLKRGKPLFLNADRLALLERQWLSHIFNSDLKLWKWMN